MFNWLRKKRYAYVDFYIILNGFHDVEIYGISGIGLKKVDKKVFDKHRGLKYWLESKKSSSLKDEKVLQNFSKHVRIEILDFVVSGLKIEHSKGFHCDGLR